VVHLAGAERIGVTTSRLQTTTIEPNFDPPEESLRLELTPLIDVVFLLLTFFLLLPAVRGDPLASLDIVLPAIGSGGGPGAEPVQIRLDPAGVILVDGEPTTASEIGPALRAAQIVPGQPARPVVLIADERGDRASLLTLLDAMALAGIEEFAIIGRPDDPLRPTEPAPVQDQPPAQPQSP